MRAIGGCRGPHTYRHSAETSATSGNTTFRAALFPDEGCTGRQGHRKPRRQRYRLQNLFMRAKTLKTQASQLTHCVFTRVQPTTRLSKPRKWAGRRLIGAMPRATNSTGIRVVRRELADSSSRPGGLLDNIISSGDWQLAAHQPLPICDTHDRT